MTLRRISNDSLIDGQKLDNLPADTNAELNLKADKTYVDSQDANLQGQIINLNNTKQNKLTPGTNTTIVGDVINSLGGPAVITDGFNRNYFTATAGQTVFNLTFTYEVGTGSILVFINGNIVQPTVAYNETANNQITFLSPLDEGAIVQVITGIKGDQGIQGIQGKGINTVTSNKVGKTTTVTVTGDFDNSPQSFNIQDGADGIGSGDMLKATYDPANGNRQVAFNDELFSGDYNDLDNKPSLFSGSYTDLTDKPTLGTMSAEDADDYYTKLQTDSLLDDKANDNAVVKLTGDQTIAGNKTFSGTISASNLSGTNTGDQDLSSYATKTGTEILTNKTLDDEIRAKQIATPSNPSSGYNKLYFKSDDKLYKLDSAGTESEVGGGGAGLSWGSSITGTSGTGLTTTIDNSASAGTIGQSIVIGNTQTQKLTGLSIDTGTSGNQQDGLLINSLNGFGIQINNNTSQTTRNNQTGLIIGNISFNNNSPYFYRQAHIINSNNAGSGRNTGIIIQNLQSSFNIGSGTFLSGAGIVLNQSGVGGKMLYFYTGSNVNNSNGLFEYTLDNTQSGATVMQKIDLGTSAQGHKAHQIKLFNASTSARGIEIDTSSTGTGIPIELITTGTGRTALKLSTGFTSDDAPVGASKYINIDIGGTTYRILAQAVS